MSAGPVIPALRAAEAASAYRTSAGAGAPVEDGHGFDAILGRALEGAVAAGHAADAQSAAAISGTGDLTHVVTAVSRAELALQTTVALRDRMVQAYQDIMHMAI